MDNKESKRQQYKYISLFWSKKEFKLSDKIYITDKIDEMFKLIKQDTSCDVSCIRKYIKQCLHNIMHKKGNSFQFEDKWHGYKIKKIQFDKSVNIDEIIKEEKEFIQKYDSYDPWFDNKNKQSLLYVI